MELPRFPLILSSESVEEGSGIRIVTSQIDFPLWSRNPGYASFQLSTF